MDQKLYHELGLNAGWLQIPSSSRNRPSFRNTPYRWFVFARRDKSGIDVSFPASRDVNGGAKVVEPWTFATRALRLPPRSVPFPYDQN